MTTTQIPPSTEEPAPAGGVRLAHEPALDGLRGAAVAAVVAFHLGRLRGGFLGVDLFFVLSGFLITSLLVAEWRDTGTLDLGRFWVRRARRLLPAILVLLAAVGLLVATMTPAADRGRLRGQGLATLFYVANWQRVAARTTYWDLFKSPSPLDHTWSLAIEEQFYLAWPLLVTVMLGRRLARQPGWRRRWRRKVLRLAGATAVAAAGSFVLLARFYDPERTNRAYFGTDTRIGTILLGALAAMAVRLRGGPRRGPPSRAVDAAGLGALAFMAASAARMTGLDATYYRGGLLAFAIAALVVIHASTGARAGVTGRLLSWRPLQSLGRISYGVYLWHWPVIVYLTPQRVGVGDGWHARGLVLDAVRVAVTLGVSLVSYRWIELPIRYGALRGTAARLATAGAVAVVFAVIVASTAPDRQAEAAARNEVPAVLTKTNTPITTASVPTSVPPGGVKVLAVGDSGAWFLKAGLQLVAAQRGDSAVAQGEVNCSILMPELRSRLVTGEVLRAGRGCPQRLERWMQLVDRFRPDVVLYYLANAGGIGKVRLNGQWLTDCDPEFDSYLRTRLGAETQMLAARGAKVVLFTTPYVVNLVDPKQSEREVDCRTRTYEQVVRDHPEVTLIDLKSFVKRYEDRGESLHRDVIHLSDKGAVIVSKWVLPQLERIAAGQPPR